jgi:ribonuclease HI
MPVGGLNKAEILKKFAEHLDAGRLLSEYPALSRQALSELLLEASKAVGPGELIVKSAPAAEPLQMPADLFGAVQPGPVVRQRLFMNTDGASRGNPGEAGIGVMIKDEAGKPVRKIARYLGTATNNQAEYAALIDGLKAAKELGAEEVSICADSELIVKQMNGLYKVKNPDLVVLHAEASKLKRSFKRCMIKYVPREQNKEADALANQAIDSRKA